MEGSIPEQTGAVNTARAMILANARAGGPKRRDNRIDSLVHTNQRIYETLYPDHSIRYIFKAAPGIIGTPERVRITRRTQDGPLRQGDVRQPYRDPDCLDILETGTSGDGPPDIEIIAEIPWPADPQGLHHDKTAPTFGHPLARFMVWKTPLLFEQLKYRYEMRQQRERTRRYRHVPVERTTHPPPVTRPASTSSTKRPAILIGFYWLELGGAEKLGLDCVQWARDAGFRVLVIADKPARQRLASRLPTDGDVEFIRTDAYLPGHLWFAFLAALIRQENIRAIHIHHHTRLYENLARIKATFPDMRVIDSTHIIEHADGGYPRLSGVWSPCIDHHHVISRELASYFLDVFDLSEKVALGRMLSPAGNGSPPAAAEFRLKVGQKSLRMIFVGRMVHQKRAPLAIAILDRFRPWARKRGISVHLDMVGTGPYLDVTRNMARRRDLVDLVTFHAPDADVPALLEKADVLLLPSSNEGLALVCYEAIQKGVIPISTRVGAQDELLPDDLLVSPSPSPCVRQTARILQLLLSKAGFATECTEALRRKYHDIGRDPTAHQVIGGLYRKILDKIPDEIPGGASRT